MKVKIQNRSVYHKFAEVEIEIDRKDFRKYMEFYTEKGQEWHDIQDYLRDNENLYADKIDEAMSKAEYEYGSGIDDYRGMVDELDSSEWRFECEELKTGGHL